VRLRSGAEQQHMLASDPEGAPTEVATVARPVFVTSWSVDAEGGAS